MKKWISLLLTFTMIFAAAVAAFAEEDVDGDDSVQIPMDIGDGEDDEETGEEKELRMLQAGDEGDDVLFLQKQKDFNLERATQVIGLAEVFGVAGNLAAGWMSDVLFRGNRVRPVVIAGILAVVSLAGFLFLDGGFGLNMACVAVFSCSFSVVFCIVAGLMALDFVPRKATGAALGIVGISSYAAAGLQSVASGLLIDGFTADGVYNFLPVSIFWIVACFLAFSLPVLGWKYLRK